MYNNSLSNSYTSIKIIWGIPLLMICPFLSFVLTLKKPFEKYNKIVFLIYFGLIGYIRKLSEGGDASSWTNTILDFISYGKRAFLFKGEDVLFNPAYYSFLYLLSYLKYTAVIWSLLFVLTAIAILYIFRLQFYATKTSCCRISSVKVFCLFVFYICFIPFTSFGVKYWVALNIFLIGFYLYINKGKKRGLLILISSVLFHFTFSYMIMLFFLHYFIENKLYKKTLFLILIIFCSVPIFYYVLSYITSDYIEFKYDVYSSGSLIEQRAMWIKLDRIFLTSFSYAALFYMFFKRKVITSKSSKSILSFLIILSIGLIPLMSTLDGLDRYSRVFSYMMLILLLKLGLEKVRHMDLMYLLSIPVFSYHMLVNFFLRKGELDVDIFFRDISYFVSGNLMTNLVL